MNWQYSRILTLLPKFETTTNTGMNILVHSKNLDSINIPISFSAINLFSYSRSISKPGPDGVEEVWIERTYLTTEEAFPTVLRRSEVIDVVVAEISPVETALQEVEQRTRELGGLNMRYSALAKTSQVVSTTPLSMALNAAVDTPINSGISLYRETFLSGDYMLRYPDRAEQVTKLRNAIDEQVGATLHVSSTGSHLIDPLSGPNDR